MAARFKVGDRVRHPARGIDGQPVHGVQVTPEGEHLQFGADGKWLPADGFSLVGPAPREEAAPAPHKEAALHKDAAAPHKKKKRSRK